MKIAVVAPIFLNIEVDVSNEDSNLLSVEGNAKISYGGCYVDFCEQLAKDGHEIMLVSCLHTQGFVHVIRMLQDKGIDTRYVMYERNGLVFDLQLNTLSKCEIHLSSCMLEQSMIDTLKLHETTIFNHIDAIVTCTADECILNMCETHSKKLYLYSDEEPDIDEDDPTQVRAADVATFVSINNYKEVLR